MAIALKDLRRELLPGLYPGWRVTQDFTTDTLWIEGPDGYVAKIPRKAIDDAGAGLDGVMEFILQKDARMKRDPSYAAAVRRAAQEMQMCAKGGYPTVNPEVMKAQQAYQEYLTENQYSPEFQPKIARSIADYEPMYEAPRKTKAKEKTHGQWDGARKLDLD